MKRKALSLISVLMIFTLMLSGCSSGTSTPDKADSDVIKIGWYGSLTGDQAVWGTCESNQLKLMVEEVNANGGLLGKKLEVVCYDTKGDSSEAVNAVKRMVSQDKVVAIIGPNSSGQALAVSSILDQNKIPGIATVATNPKVTVNDDGSVKPYNFRICFIDPYQGAVTAGYAYEKLGLKNAAVLYDVASDYSQGFTQYFEETFIKSGGQMVAKEAFKSGDVDFRPQLSKIKEANPDVILLPILYKEVALIANQARELGITAVFMGGDGWPSDQLIPMAGNSVEGSYVVNHLDFGDPSAKPVADAYKAKYNTNVELNAFLAHDAFRLLEAAIKDANSFDSVKIAESLTKVSIVGVTGNIKLSPEDHNPSGKEAAITKIENGKFVFVEKYGVKIK